MTRTETRQAAPFDRCDQADGVVLAEGAPGILILRPLAYANGDAATQYHC